LNLKEYSVHKLHICLTGKLEDIGQYFLSSIFQN